jgi:ribosomal protein S18 acetylase RimI-like enzyme
LPRWLPMVGSKLLLDANILIALEDPKIVPPSVAALAQKAHLFGISMFLDESCVEDIQRDPNLERRRATLSKVQKFPILTQIAHRSRADQESRFGSIKDDNDRCDVQMLDTLDLGVVDFLVTEDVGIHKRAQRAGLRRRVFAVQEALAWIQRTFEPKEFRLRNIVARKAHQISVDDPIFDGLRKDYVGFDEWFVKCRREHRSCWVVEIEGLLAGLVVHKDETHSEAGTVHQGPRILKICTLKMKSEHQGEKFGEQLLKKILWFAQGNNYDLIYLTVFPKQDILILLLKTFGFHVTREQSNGELLMERPMLKGEPPFRLDRDSVLEFDFSAYPRFFDGPSVSKYVIPIRPEFHTILFPEIAEAPDLPLFPEQKFLITTGPGSGLTPGNTIRKVYICRSPTRTLAPGDVALFYLSKAADLVRSQSVTTVGIVERARLAESASELIRLVGRRSVYSRESLEAMNPTEDSPVLVIDFLLNGHFNPYVTLDALIDSGVFVGKPPQSIKQIGDDVYGVLQAYTQVAFE